MKSTSPWLTQLLTLLGLILLLMSPILVYKWHDSFFLLFLEPQDVYHVRFSGEINTERASTFVGMLSGITALGLMALGFSFLVMTEKYWKRYLKAIQARLKEEREYLN